MAQKPNSTHQRVRNASGTVGSSTLGPTHVGPDCSTTRRQLFDSPVYKKGGGGTRSAILSRLATEILDTCHLHHIRLIPSHLPGLANTESDALSRQKTQDEWHLNHRVADKIFDRLGLPEIDLFASQHTHQVPIYFTLDQRDNQALGIDALAHPWEFQIMYAFHSPAILLHTIQKFRLLGGKLLLVAPYWKEAPWCPEVASMLYKQPFRLRYRNDLITNQSTGLHLSSLNRLRLTVWPFSRPQSKPRKPPQKLLNTSLYLGGDQRLSNTNPSGGPGLHGVRLRDWNQLPFL